MTDVLGELLELLELETIEENIFRGQSQDLGFGNVFGGQVLGQALSAASQTVPDDRNCHSLHAYFLRPGDPRRPIVYQVDPIRDGRSFTTRRVVAIQKGRAIFSLSASFQLREDGYEHQAEMPAVRPPDGLLSDLDLARRVADRIPEPMRTKMICDKPIELRPIDPVDPFAPVAQEPVQHAWLRAVGELPDDPAVHQYLLAYASDFRLVTTSMHPHATTYWDPHMQVASLDHSMWFHRDFRMDEWLLHAMESPAASHARGIARGLIYRADGTLVASVAQEGLIRRRSTTRTGGP
ncbi:MAG: acyl-CoA thioesterase II [Myxococcota bacterium]|jgi:acyl-CoA thioesterase-2|nr:acyl-CoA thioesterase II [Myxococcota bacterium]